MKLSLLRFLRKNWKSKETHLLLIALIFAVSMLATFSFYIDRIQRTLDGQAREFLGGDLIINSPTPPPTSWIKQAQILGCQQATATIFPSIVSHLSNLQLATIKAVSPTYPLYGSIEIVDHGKKKNLHHIPKPGNVWINPAFLKSLHLQLNDNIQVGYATFTVSAILSHEPDSDPFGLTIAPRILMNSQDLPLTHIIQPGSRVNYRFYFSGNKGNIEQLKKWLLPQLQKNQKLITLKENAGELADTLQKANAFLYIAILIIILLAGVAIANTSRYFLQRQYTTIALLRCFGLKQKQILCLYGFYFLILGLMGSFIGVCLGYFLQLGIDKLLSQLLQFKLAATHLWPVITSLLAGVIILFNFSFPFLIHLKQISPSLILKKQAIPPANQHAPLLTTLLLLLSSAIGWYSNNFKLMAIILFSFVFSGVLLYSASWLFIRALSPLRKSVGVSWRYGLANLLRRPVGTAIQLTSFGFIFMVSLLLVMLRADLIKSWEAQIPLNAPNYFAINILPTEVVAFDQMLKELSLIRSHSYPMVKGRIIALNGIPIMQAVPASERRNNALNRELNLTWANEILPNNKILAGKWWSAKEKGQNLVSIENDLAHSLKIKIGDKITFQIGYQRLDATVYSLRSVNWYSFQPNFFMIFPEKVLDNFPTSYINSFFIPPNKKSVLLTINERFPGVTLIDVSQLLNQIQNIVKQITFAINAVLGLLLLAATITLQSAVLTSHDERIYENAILRSLGANKKQLLMGLLTEFWMIGFLAGTIGLLLATGSLIALTVYILKITPHINAKLYIFIPFLSGFFVCAVGFSASYKVMRTSPLQVIREV